MFVEDDCALIVLSKQDELIYLVNPWAIDNVSILCICSFRNIITSPATTIMILCSCKNFFYCLNALLHFHFALYLYLLHACNHGGLEQKTEENQSITRHLCSFLSLFQNTTYSFWLKEKWWIQPEIPPTFLFFYSQYLSFLSRKTAKVWTVFKNGLIMPYTFHTIE